jgi:hypothetical protein
MAKKNPNDVQVHVEISQELHRRLRIAVIEDGTTIKEVFKNCIEQYMQSRSKQADGSPNSPSASE